MPRQLSKGHLWFVQFPKPVFPMAWNMYKWAKHSHGTALQWRTGVPRDRESRCGLETSSHWNYLHGSMALWLNEKMSDFFKYRFEWTVPLIKATKDQSVTPRLVGDRRSFSAAAAFRWELIRWQGVYIKSCLKHGMMLLCACGFINAHYLSRPSSTLQMFLDQQQRW